MIFCSFLNDGISNGYMLMTINELQPWVFLAFKLLCKQDNNKLSMCTSFFPHIKSYERQQMIFQFHFKGQTHVISK